MNLILCGPPKCGKTTLGKKLAEKLDWSFVDSDQQVEVLYQLEHLKNCSCRDIYRLEGEAAFRERERRAIASLQGVSKTVVALGGGALISKESRIFVRQLGRVAYLKMDAVQLWERMVQEPALPAYLDVQDPFSSLKTLLQQRLPHYEEVAHIVINCSQKSEIEVLNNLVNFLAWTAEKS